MGVCHSGISHCPGMHLPRTRNSAFDSGTVPGKVVTLTTSLLRKLGVHWDCASFTIGLMSATAEAS